MPKAKRSSEEIENIRESIMDEALELISTDGYDGFSMRKLAARLGIAARTIYSYFQNQDELYLCVHIKGFEQLFECYKKAAIQHENPMDKIGAIIEAFVEFGIENPNIYNLMHTWQVPRANEYIGTTLEKVANLKLKAAMKTTDFAIDLAIDYLENSPGVNENELRAELIQAWSHMHGYVAGINNSVLDYMYDNPISLKKMVIDRVLANVRSTLNEYRHRLGLTVVSDKVMKPGR